MVVRILIAAFVVAFTSAQNGCSPRLPQCCAGAGQCDTFPTAWPGACCPVSSECCLKFPGRFFTPTQQLGNFLCCSSGLKCLPVNRFDTGPNREFACIDPSTVPTALPTPRPSFKKRPTRFPTASPLVSRQRPTPVPGCRACCLDDPYACSLLNVSMFPTSCCAHRDQCCQVRGSDKVTPGNFACCGAGQQCNEPTPPPTNPDPRGSQVGEQDNQQDNAEAVDTNTPGVCTIVDQSCPACCLGEGKCGSIPITAGSCCSSAARCCQTGPDPFKMGSYQCCDTDALCTVVSAPAMPRQAKCIKRAASCADIRDCGACTLAGCQWMPGLGTCSAMCHLGVKECTLTYNKCNRTETGSSSSQAISCKGRCNAGGTQRYNNYVSAQSFSSRTANLNAAYNFFPNMRLGPNRRYDSYLSSNLFSLSNRFDCLCDEDCKLYGDCCSDVDTHCPVATKEKQLDIVFPLYFKFSDSTHGPCQTSPCTCSADSSLPSGSFTATFTSLGLCTAVQFRAEMFYLMLVKNDWDSHYDILSFSDKECRKAIAGTTTFSLSQLGVCSDGPSSCNCKFRVYDSKDLFLAPAVNSAAKPEIKFPLFYQFTFGSACLDPSKCSCDDQPFFPSISWSASYLAPYSCAETLHEGRRYYTQAVPKSTGEYQIRSFSDSKCLDLLPGVIDVDPAEMCKCKSAGNRRGHFRVCSEEPKLPAVFSWTPTGSTFIPCGLDGSDDNLRNYLHLTLTEVDKCESVKFKLGCPFAGLECGFPASAFGLELEYSFKLTFKDNSWVVARYKDKDCATTSFSGETYPFLMQDLDKNQCLNGNNLRNLLDGSLILAKYKVSKRLLDLPVVFSWDFHSPPAYSCDDGVIDRCGCGANEGVAIGRLSSSVTVGFSALDACTTVTAPGRNPSSYTLTVDEAGVYSVTEFRGTSCSIVTNGPFEMLKGIGECHSTAGASVASGRWDIRAAEVDKEIMIRYYSDQVCQDVAGGCVRVCSDPYYRDRGLQIGLTRGECTPVPTETRLEYWLYTFVADGSYSIIKCSDPACTVPISQTEMSFRTFEIGRCVQGISGTVFRVDENSISLPIKYHVVRGEDCGDIMTCLCRYRTDFVFGAHQIIHFSSVDVCTINTYKGVTKAYKLLRSKRGAYEISEFSDLRCLSRPNVLTAFQKSGIGNCIPLVDRTGRSFIEKD